MSLQQDLVLILFFAVLLPLAFTIPIVAFCESPRLRPASVLASALACVATAWHLVDLLRATKPAALWAAMIVLTVPVYALLCWMTMLLEDFEVWYEVYKSLYESFVLFCFLMLLDVTRRGDKSANERPFWLVMQYVLFNLAAAFVFFRQTNPSGLLSAFFLVGACISCSIALAAVFALHHEYDTGLLRDSCKFWCIKGLVGALFNQHLLLGYGLQLFPGLSNAVPPGLERVIVCFELLPLALAHCWAYHADEFSDLCPAPTIEAGDCSGRRFGYGSTRASSQLPQEEKEQAEPAQEKHLDGTFAVAFLGIYSGLLVFTYTSVLKTAEVAARADDQASKCKWYYWFRYGDHCSPAYYRTEAWLDAQRERNHTIRAYLLAAFGLLFAASGAYVLVKKHVIRLHADTEAVLIKVATRFLIAFLLLVSVPLAWIATQAVCADPVEGQGT